MSTVRVNAYVAAVIEACLDASRNIDLHLESMVASRERAVAGVTSGLIGLGQEVRWEARHLGIRWRMTSRITSFDRPNRFVDEMVDGPFDFFQHEHRFQEFEAGTSITDVVKFRVGYGLIGPAADLVARAYLRRLLRTRSDAIRRYVEGS